MGIARKIKADRISSFGTTVFTVWSNLAQKHGAINLGQGFPDFPPPDFALRALEESSKKNQQYAPLPGIPELREVLARQYSREWNRPIDGDAEVTVTVGATEGIFASIIALVDPGDEVILIEPFYDSYPASVIMAGGIPKYLPLVPNSKGEWEFDPDELKKLLSPKTKMLILNTPHNPTGKVFSKSELEIIAEIAKENDLIVLADEVYNYMVFEGRHLSIATLPDMWERTITLGSVAKTFNATGWKVGWAIASPPLTEAIRMAHQWIPFCVSRPMQYAAEKTIREAEKVDFYSQLAREYREKRDLFVSTLSRVGLRPFVPQGTYFVMADTSEFNFDSDEEFCRYLTVEVGVTAIPPSHFYSEPHKHLAKHLVRFAFCKRNEVLKEAIQRLEKIRNRY